MKHTVTNTKELKLKEKITEHEAEIERQSELILRLRNQIDLGNENIGDLIERIKKLEAALKPFAQFECGCGECNNCVADNLLNKEK